jgi:multidrug efflux pump subunit AcrA (membrane-fusion protein)
MIMATDVAAFKARLIDERAAVAAAIATIDVNAERALLDQAQAQLDAARATYDKKSQRWTLVNDKLDRLKILDDQIALLG